MQFEETKLKGSFVITSDSFEDERGFFGRYYCEKEFADAGLHTLFVQCNQSGTYGTGSIRGMHFQYPPHAEVKLVKCIKGKILDVIVDIRKGSDTFLQWFSIELSAENRKAIYIPKGFAHGFQTLMDYCEIIYMVSDFYKKDSEGGIRYNDNKVSIEWPLTVNKISHKDLNIPFVSSTSFAGVSI